MKKLFTYFSFWLILFSLTVSSINLLGYDDKNLLLYITSPPLWILNEYSSFLRRFISYETLSLLMNIIALLFWIVVGMLLDAVFFRTRRQKLMPYLKLTVIACGLSLVLSALFYSTQNSEYTIDAILNNPSQYSKENVQHAVLTAAKEGSGEQYLLQMESILQTTEDREIFVSTLHALGTIGTPDSISLLLQYYRDPIDILFPLQMNEPIIITMLGIDQPQAIIESGIEAARILSFEAFITPLRELSEAHPVQHIQQSAAEVLEQILQNPQHNNPKFYVN